MGGNLNYIKKVDKVDILFVCEGTFPYIKGGVSSWIYQVIKSMKDLKFGVIFLGGLQKDYSDIKYDLPENLIHLETHFIFESLEQRVKIKKIKEIKDLKIKLMQLHNWFRTYGNTLADELKRYEFYEKVDEEQFLRSKNSFEFITEEYIKNASDVPFIDYFWTVRSIHAPLWKIVNISKRVPYAKIVHSPSSGYAGFLSSFIKNNQHIKFVLTEHGIYMLERKIDIMLASWIDEYKISLSKNPSEKNYIKELWIRFFSGINKFTYESADIIISLYDGARKIQLELGADLSKTMIIPNGINIERFKKFRKNYQEGIPKKIALIGRVVPIKDVKTFITAVKIISSTIKDIEALIVGPYDEDLEYYNECKQLVSVLGLEKHVKFTGFKNIDDVLSDISLLCLTSISEGMPLVIIEGFAAGIPVVATDVGSCKQLLYGMTDDDIRIGKSGEIVPVAKPNEVANAVIKILTNPKLWYEYSKNAILRVEKYYDEKVMIEKYRSIYKQLAGI